MSDQPDPSPVEPASAAPRLGLAGRLAQQFQANALTPLLALAAAKLGLPAGAVLDTQASANGNPQLLAVQTGDYLRSADEVADLVVGVNNGRPVYLREVAEISDGPAQAQRYVWYTPGAGAATAAQPASGAANPLTAAPGQVYPAVTLTLTKQPGRNAVDVAQAARARLDELRNTVIPEGVQATITRDYGQTAAEKANKLIQKLAFATASVIGLVGLALGRREAVIVGAAVILTLTATLFASWAWGFTLNRVSLFALIFSIGILVDDAIVVVENIHRHQALTPGKPLREIIPAAVDEVGGPTILATLTVIAALLPMAFVSGLMGPYMNPIPINASLGMALSLMIAFTVTPWLALRLMKPGHEHGDGAAQPASNRLGDALARGFQRVLMPFLDSARRRWMLAAGIVARSCGAVAVPSSGVPAGMSTISWNSLLLSKGSIFSTTPSIELGTAPRAEALGIPVAVVAQTVAAALSGTDAAWLHQGQAKYPVAVRLQLPREVQVGLDALLALPLRSAGGALVPLGELVRVERGVIDKPLFTKDLYGVSYVFGDMAGPLDSPLYGLFAIRPKLAALGLDEYWIHPPSDPFRAYAIKWDGESQITYDTFRDIGAAYGVGLILIYLLVVAQFRSYLTPLVIMAPIPLTM